MKLCIGCGKNCTGKRCKECHRKYSGKSFDFGVWNFETQTDLDRVIKTIIKESRRNIEFENPFLSSFLNKYHSSMVKRNFKVIKFKILDWYGQTDQWEFCRDRFRGGIYIIGFFEPINEWHGVTLYPHKKSGRDVRNKLILSLRQKWSETAKKRDPQTLCEYGHPYPQLHHDSESFKEIAEECLKEFSTQELEEGVGEDWWLHENEADALSDNHPAVIKLHELHKFVKYRWLCDSCHKEEHKKKGEQDGDNFKSI